MTSQAQTQNYQRIKEASCGVHLLPWYYIGGAVLQPNGELEVNLPADVTAVVIEARGGYIHYNVNGVNCDTNSPGYIVEDGMRTIGPLSNLTSLWIYGADATTYAHIQFYREM